MDRDLDPGDSPNEGTASSGEDGSVNWTRQKVLVSSLVTLVIIGLGTGVFIYWPKHAKTGDVSQSGNTAKQADHGDSIKEAQSLLAGDRVVFPKAEKMVSFGDLAQASPELRNMIARKAVGISLKSVTYAGRQKGFWMRYEVPAISVETIEQMVKDMFLGEVSDRGLWKLSQAVRSQSAAVLDFTLKTAPETQARVIATQDGQNTEVIIQTIEGLK